MFLFFLLFQTTPTIDRLELNIFTIYRIEIIIILYVGMTHIKVTFKMLHTLIGSVG